jgi:hypothetical protein
VNNPDNQAALPIEQMLQDANSAWQIQNGNEQYVRPDLWGDLSCHIRALVSLLEKADAEIRRLREYEWMYKDLCK